MLFVVPLDDDKTVTLGDLSGSESLLLLPPDDLSARVVAAFMVRCAVLLVSILAILSSLLLAQADSIDVKLVLFMFALLSGSSIALANCVFVSNKPIWKHLLHWRMVGASCQWNSLGGLWRLDL